MSKLFTIMHAKKPNYKTKLFIECCPLSGKVYIEHYISKLLLVMHWLCESNKHILNNNNKKKTIEVLVITVAIESL